MAVPDTPALTPSAYPRVTAGEGFLILYPPTAPKAWMPEISLPLLQAQLKREGVPTAVDDLNIRLRCDRYLNPENVALLQRRLPENPVPATFFRLDRPGALGHLDALLAESAESASAKLRTLAHLDYLDAYARVFERFMGITLPDYRITTVKAALQAGNPFLESFFADAVLSRLPHGIPPVVGFSLPAQQQTFPLLVFARMLKRLRPDVFIAVGGPWAVSAKGVLDRFVAAFDEIDAGCYFEGLHVIGDLYRAAVGQGSWDDVAGHVVKAARLPAKTAARLAMLDPAATREPHASTVARWRPSGDGPYTPPAPPVPLASVVRTPWKAPPLLERQAPGDYEGMPLHLYPELQLPVQSTRNCYYGKCTFCYHSMPSSVATFEERSAAGVVDEMARLKAETGVKTFYIADPATRTPLMEAIAREILRRGLDVEYLALVRATGAFDRRLSSLLAMSGLRVANIGLETTDAAQLKRVRKGVSLAKMESDIKNLAEAGVTVNLFVLDLPGQSLAAYERTLKWVLARTKYINAILPQRFELGRSSPVFEKPELLGLTIDPEAEYDLDIWGHAFTADENTVAESVYGLTRTYVERIAAARAELQTRGV